jgi:hypothetical protein
VPWGDVPWPGKVSALTEDPADPVAPLDENEPEDEPNAEQPPAKKPGDDEADAAKRILALQAIEKATMRASAAQLRYNASPTQSNLQAWEEAAAEVERLKEAATRPVPFGGAKRSATPKPNLGYLLSLYR